MFNVCLAQHVDWLTCVEFQLLVMHCSLPVDWLYDRVMLQLLETAGTAKTGEV